MQTIEQYGVRYISHMTWEEKDNLMSFLKPVKIYDYVYLVPNDYCTRVTAIRSKSIVCVFDIPIVLPGILCVSLSALAYPAQYRAEDIDHSTGRAKKGATAYYCDVTFASLEECLNKYIMISRSPAQYVVTPDFNVICTPAYHLIPMIDSSINEIFSYIGSNPKCITYKTTEEVFETRTAYSSLFAADGVKFFAVDNKHIVTLFAGMLPLNKADELEITIYDHENDDKFLTMYSIKKKKMDPINVYMFLLRV